MRQHEEWDTDLAADDGGGLLWSVVRNAVAVIAICLVLAWVVVGGDDAPPPPAQQTQALSGPGRAPAPAAAGDNELAIPAAENGHFFVSALANGTQIQFLIDTGASVVMLTEADAKRAGLYLASLDFADRVRTANGEITAARTVLRDIRIAGLVVDDVEAWVTRAPLPVSLLGMSFLNRLAAVEARGDRLILRW